MVTFLAGPPPPRLAFAVTRKVGTAVVRNRLRRQLREGFRLLARSTTLRGGSYLISARPAAAGASFGSLTDDLENALRQCGALA